MASGLISRRPGALPVEVTSFVGRRGELTQLACQLRTTRLATVTGPGGVGKTRVALRTAAGCAGQFADGVCLAELAGLRDPAALAKLPAEERQAGQQLWADVEALLRKAQRKE